MPNNNEMQYGMNDYRLKEAQVRLYLKEGTSLYSTEPIRTSQDAAKLVQEYLKDMDRELVVTVNFDAKGKPINFNTVSIGDIDSASVPIPNVFKSAFLSNASRVMMFHNHPSGDVSPSGEDFNITKRVVEAGKLLGVNVMDHIIVGVGTESYFSFRESDPSMFIGTNPDMDVINSITGAREETSEYSIGNTDKVTEYNNLSEIKENNEMLTRDEFINKMYEEIKDNLPEDYNDAIVLIEPVDKVNESYTGLCVKKPEIEMAPTIDLDNAYHIYRDGYMQEYENNMYQKDDKSFDRIMDAVSEIIQGAYEEMDSKTLNSLIDISDYDKAKNSMFIRLSGEERLEALEKMPHKEVAPGLYASYHVQIPNPEGDGFYSAAVSNVLLDAYGVSLDQLHNDALASAESMMPAQIESLNGIVMRLSGMDMEAPVEKDPLNSYILTTSEQHFGASAILYPDVKEMISERLGGDYYILPSSTHELLVLHDDGSGNYMQYEQMVRDVNEMVVSNDDKLSDTVYHYDHSTGEIQTARDFYHDKDMTIGYLESNAGRSYVNEEKAEYNAGDDRKKVYISLHKAYCHTRENEKTGNIYHQMTMPKGTILDGKDIGGARISPKYMQESKYNPNEMVATYYVPNDKPLEVKLIKGTEFEMVDIEKVKQAVDQQKETYRASQMAQDKGEEKVIINQKDKDQGEEI